jgi:hypothetical protein
MPLSGSETLLHEALRDYLAAVATQKSPHPPQLGPFFVRLDSLEKEHAAQLDPRLRHFLESKSYRKAHDYLDSLVSSDLAKPSSPIQTCSK